MLSAPRAIALGLADGPIEGGHAMPKSSPAAPADGLSDALGNVAALVAGGVLTPTDELEARVLRLMGVRSDVTVRPWADRLGRATPDDAPVSQGGRPSTSPEVSR
jgi:hypothetical protein